MTCSVHKGDLPINLSWLHNNISLGYMDGITVLKAGKKASTITIESVQEQHAGTYSCLAENKAGQVRYSDQLDVNGTFTLLFVLCKIVFFSTPSNNTFHFWRRVIEYGRFHIFDLLCSQRGFADKFVVVT